MKTDYLEYIKILAIVSTVCTVVFANKSHIHTFGGVIQMWVAWFIALPTVVIVPSWLFAHTAHLFHLMTAKRKMSYQEWLNDQTRLVK